MKAKLLLIILFLGIHSLVQSQNFNWAYSFGSSANGAGSSGLNIVTDKNGNVYTLGLYNGKIDFNPSDDSCFLSSLPNSQFDGFISKTDTYGNFIWAKKLNGINLLNKNPGLTTDSLGNVYVVWTFNSYLIFDEDSINGKLLADTLNSNNGFVLKLDPNGSIVWLNKLSTNLSVTPNVIAIDKLGDICIAGGFEGRVDFDPSLDTFNLLNSSLNKSSFILKLNSHGEFKWVKAFTGGNGVNANSIAISANNEIIIGGDFRGKCDFDPSEDSSFLESKTSNGYIALLSPLGDLEFVKSFAGGRNYCNSISLDNLGNILITGSYQDTVDFNPGAPLVNRISSNANTFISKLDSLGNFVWIKTLGGSFSGNEGKRIVVGDSGNVFISGWFSTNTFGPLDFDPGPGVYNENGAYDKDIFILKLNSFGLFAWVKTIQSFKAEVMNGLALDKDGNLLLTGVFTGNVDFDPNASTYQLSGPANEFGYVLKLGSCQLYITKQPQSLIAIVGSNRIFMVASNQENASYTWQINDSSGFKDITDTSHYVGINNDTLLVKNILYSPFAQYRCTIQNGNCKAVSHTANLQIVCDFKLLVEPKTVWVKEDSSMVFVVKANASGVQFIWQVNTGSGFYDLLDTGVFSGVSTDSLKIVSASFTQNGYAFRCVLSRLNCNIISSKAVLLVKCNFQFSVQPVSSKIGVTEATSFQAKVFNELANYTWQENRGEGFKEILDTGVYFGSKTDSLFISRSSQFHNQAQFRCLVNINNCESSSDTVTLLVACKFSILVQPKSLYLRYFQNAIFEVIASDSNLKYTWQRNSSGVFVSYPDSLQTNTISFLYTLNSPTNYRCLVSDSFCTLTSDIASINYCQNAKFLDQPKSQIVNKGTNVQLSVTTEAFTKNYQWQIKTSDSTYADLSNSSVYGGATNAILYIYNFGIGLNNKEYRCKLVDGNCSIYSNSATITLYNPNGILDQEMLDPNAVYPNPNNGQITLDLPAMKFPLDYFVTDLNGKILLNGVVSESKTVIDLKQYSSGCYFLKIATYRPLKLIKY